MQITFGEFIRQTRDKKDLSLREMAKQLDCSPAFLSDIELGKRFPSDKILEKISDVLKVSKAELGKYDIRSTVDDFKRISQRDPGYALAFRQAMDNKLDSGALLKAINKLKK